MDWFFSGLGTFLIGLLVGVGGTTGYFVVVKPKSIRQRQRSGRNSINTQIGDASIDSSRDKRER